MLTGTWRYRTRDRQPGPFCSGRKEGDPSIGAVVLEQLARGHSVGSRGACLDLLWLISEWKLLEPELCRSAHDAVVAFIPIFGMSWAIEVLTGKPRPFGEVVSPRPLSDLDEVVKEILEAATGIEPVYGALQAPA